MTDDADLAEHGLADPARPKSGGRRRRSYPVLPPVPPQRRARRHRYRPPRLGWPRGLAVWHEILRFRLMPLAMMLGAPAGGAAALCVAVVLAVLHLTQPRHRAPVLVQAAPSPIATAAEGTVGAIGEPLAVGYDSLLANLFALEPARLDDMATIRGYAARYDCDDLRGAGANEFRRARIYDRARAEMRDFAHTPDPTKATYKIRQKLAFGDYDFTTASFPVRTDGTFRFTLTPPASQPGEHLCPARDGLPPAFIVEMDDAGGFTRLAMPPEKAEQFLASRTLRAHDGLHTEPDRSLTAEVTFRVTEMQTPRADDAIGGLGSVRANPVVVEAEMVGYRVFAGGPEPVFVAAPEQIAEHVARARAQDAARPILARFALAKGRLRDGAVSLSADQLPLLYAALSRGTPPIDDYLQALPAIQALPLFSSERTALTERLRRPLEQLAARITDQPDRLWRVSLPVRLARPTGPDDAVAVRALSAEPPGLESDLGSGHYALALDPPDAAAIPAVEAENAVAANAGMRVMSADLLMRPARTELSIDGRRTVIMHLVAIELRGRGDGRLILRHDLAPGANAANTHPSGLTAPAIGADSIGADSLHADSIHAANAGPDRPAAQDILPAAGPSLLTQLRKPPSARRHMEKEIVPFSEFIN
jgi:hypothetical protein